MGAVSLDRLFFSFSSLFLSWWPFGSWRWGPLIHVGVLHGIDQPRSRSAIISRGSSVTQRGTGESALHCCTAAPQGLASQRRWLAPGRPNGTLLHLDQGSQGTASKLAALAALANNNTLRPALHTRRDASGPSQRWDWPIAATASRACPRTPSFTRRARFPSSP